MLRNKFFCLIIAVFFLSLSSFADESESVKIKQLIASREYNLAIKILSELKQSKPAEFEKANYDYLLARIAEKSGDFAVAMANYQSVVNRDSILKEYALWHLAKISSSAGDLMIERLFLNELITEAPRSLFRQTAEKRMASSLFESGDNNQLNKRLFITFSDQMDSDQPDRDSMALLGKSLLRLRRLEEAKSIFQQILQSTPEPNEPDDFDLIAIESLDELDQGKNISDEEHFQRGKIYFINREFRQARIHLTAILENFPNSSLIAESMHLIARSYQSEENFNDAIKWHERVISEFPRSDFAKNSLSQVASCYLRVNKAREAISRYKKYIELYPNDERIDRVYLNIVDILRDIGEESDALSWIEKIRRDFRGSPAEALALFTRARIKIAQNDWTQALKDLDDLQKIVGLIQSKAVAGGTDEIEIKFLKAYCLEQLKEYQKAAELYASIADGRKNYYGWRASERLRELIKFDDISQHLKQKFDCGSIDLKSTNLSNAEPSRKRLQTCLRLISSKDDKQKLLDALRKVYLALSSYRSPLTLKILEINRINFPKLEINARRRLLAEALFSLNLGDEAVVELEAAQRSLKSPASTGSLADFPDNIAYTLGFYYSKSEFASRASGWLEFFWREIPNDYQLEIIPTSQLQILYPTPYAELILRNAEEKKIEPHFILSIIKQESAFRNDARSSAAARGLTQIISPTANSVAAELNMTNFKVYDLYNPSISIDLGSAYLLKLFKLFPNQPQVVAAAYNAGENNALRWLVHAKSNDPDRYVSEIQFPQTKDYAFKVMTNYRMYKMIYDEKLNLR